MDLDTMERRLRRLEDEFKKFEPMLTMALPGWLDDHLAREMERVAAVDRAADEARYEAENKNEAEPAGNPAPGTGPAGNTVPPVVTQLEAAPPAAV